MNVTDKSNGSQYHMSTSVENVVEEQRKDTETTVKTDFEANNAFLRRNYSKLSRPGLSL